MTFFPPAQVELLSLPPLLVEANAVRGSVLALSMRNVREAGMTNAYYETLDTDLLWAVRNLPQTGWVPMDVAVGHYSALEALGMTARDARRAGEKLTKGLDGSFAGTVVRRLQTDGAVSPRSLAPRLGLLWSRWVRGGGLRVSETGDREVRIDVRAMPLMRFRYCRDGFEGVLNASFGLLARKATVRATVVHPDGVTYRAHWT